MNSYPYGSDGSSSDEENDSGGFDALGCNQLVQVLLKEARIPKGQSISSYAKFLEKQFRHQCFSIDQRELDEYKVVTPAQKRMLQEKKQQARRKSQQRKFDAKMGMVKEGKGKYAFVDPLTGKKATHNIANLSPSARREIENIKGLVLCGNGCYTPSYLSDSSPKFKSDTINARRSYMPVKKRGRSTYPNINVTRAIKNATDIFLKHDVSRNPAGNIKRAIQILKTLADSSAYEHWPDKIKYEICHKLSIFCGYLVTILSNSNKKILVTVYTHLAHTYMDKIDEIGCSRKYKL